ncbi:MAG TPA: penicillin-binding protein 2 [Bryobacteraceae bacterium]
MGLIKGEHRREGGLSPGRSQQDDPKRFSGKIAIFQYLTVAVFIFLVSGFWTLQVKNSNIYSQAAERNRIRSTPILAPRGKILDRYGRVIVGNKASYSLLLNRDEIQSKHLPAIAAALHLNYNDLLSKIQRMSSQPQIIIKDQLTGDEIAWVEAHQDVYTYPEMQLVQSWERQYPENGFAAHVAGYVGEISQSELNLPQFIDYEPGAIIGKAGLEREYDRSLRGVNGKQRILVDNLGQERATLTRKPAIPGQDLHTTIDLDLEAVATLSLQGRRGAVVALDPRDGEVLAMVSRPGFDPNQFAGHISQAEWEKLVNDPDKPLMNRATQAELAPGSTFKPFVALAGLETGVITPTTQFYCPGGATFYGHYFRCWRKGGHGHISVHRALVESCDVFFYTVANRLGIDHLAHYAKIAGFGGKTGIDLPHESKSTMPSTRWKMRMFRQKWYAGETISVGIGQGAVTISPLQLAVAEGGLAVGGKWYRPHLNKNVPKKLLRNGHFNPKDIAAVLSGMCGVVNEPGGTGGYARLPDIEVCGKTGTAQVASTSRTSGAKMNSALANNAWFVGFAPADNPEIVVVALVDHAGESVYAEPIVRDVLKAYFDKKARLARTQTARAWQRSLPNLFGSMERTLAMLAPSAGKDFQWQ